jgi:hypothetical protein
MLEYLDYEAQVLALPGAELEVYHGRADARTWLLRHAPRRLELHTKGKGAYRVLNYGNYELRLLDYQRDLARHIPCNYIYYDILGSRDYPLPSGASNTERTKRNLPGVVWRRERAGECTELRVTGEISHYQEASARYQTSPHSDFLEAIANSELIFGRRRSGEIWWTSIKEWHSRYATLRIPSLARAEN